MLQPHSAAGGSRINGRTTPISTGAAIRSQIATPTRRATPSASASARHRSAIASASSGRLDRRSRSTPTSPVATRASVASEPDSQTPGR